MPNKQTKENLLLQLEQLQKENEHLKSSLQKGFTAQTIQLFEANENLKKTNEQLLNEIVGHKKAEEALHKIKLQYDNLVSKIPIGIYLMRSNSSGKLTPEYISSKAASIFNISVENLMSDSLLAFKSIHPDDISELSRLNKEGIIARKPFDWKGRFLIEGTVKWVHISSSPELLEDGDVLWHGLVADITERMEAEEALRSSEQKYHLLVDKANEAIVVVQGGLLKLANPMTITLTGYSLEELESIPFQMFIHPEDRDLILENYQRRLNGEEIKNYYVFRLLSKNGTTHWVYMNAVLIDWEGSPATLNFLTDITELRLAEEALQQSSEKWEALIAASPDGIGMITLDGKIQLISEKLVVMHGYSAEDRKTHYGKSIFDFIDPSSHELLIANTRKLITGVNENKVTEYLALKKDKSRFYIDVKSIVIHDVNGNPNGILYVERDITERKKAEDELKQKNLELEELNATKDKFFSIIAHDLKSPFQGLLGYSELLSSEYSTLTEEEKISFIRSIEELSHSSYKLLENLLEWSRIQTGQMIFNPEEFNLLVELYPTLSLVKHTAQNKGIEFKYVIDNSIFVTADKNMLSTIVRNLISNSIKFTEPHGKITLTAERFGIFIKLSVTDTGVGINKDDLQRLFKINRSVSTKGTAKEEGTGLGLLLCKEMVEKHGGKIFAESEPGKGSVFSFTIQSFN